MSRLGLQGDDQDDREHHGGPERAVCIYSLEKIQALQAEGHPIQIGTVGENLTVEGINWESVMPGVRLGIGEEVELEVTSFTSPCKTIRRSFIEGRFVRISQKVHPGWSRVYARVIAEGEVHLGDPVEILAPADPRPQHIRKTVPLLNSKDHPPPSGPGGFRNPPSRGV